MACADKMRVTHASANVVNMLGIKLEAVLGQPLSAVIGEAACAGLAAAANGRGEISYTGTFPGPGGALLSLDAFRSGRLIGLDIEPTHTAPWHGAPVGIVQSVIASCGSATSSAELCELAVRGLRAITGYDRVMAYRFAEDLHGEVIAEARSEELEPFLGLNYPASDVPPQARELYLRKIVGTIADTEYVPVPLLRDLGWQDESPVDLTQSILRSISPMHLQYMRNMEVAAAMRIALVRGKALWGMFVCHHRTPYLVDPELRAAAGMIGQIVSLALGSLGDVEILARRMERSALLHTLVEGLASARPMTDVFAAAGDQLLGLVGATGAAVRIAGKLVCHGNVPPPAMIERALGVLLNAAGGESLAIDGLGTRFPEFAGAAGGALVLPLAHDADDAILWFRPELSQIILWGGNPAEYAILNPVTAQLSPRASFAAWKETVAGKSARWTPADVALAEELRRAFAAASAQRLKSELVKLRDYDALTGLPNRNLLQRKLVEASRHPETGTALLFIGLSQSSEISDALGYAAADALLVEFAARLTAAAGKHAFVARYGGTELAVLCSGLAKLELDALGERIRRAMEPPFEINGQARQVVPVIRLAVAGETGQLDLALAADMFIFQSKAAVEINRNTETQRQKMEGLGRMIGGIAHEINNMLQPVALLGQDILDNKMVTDPGREHLGIILDCNNKARQIIGDLLAFSRPTGRVTEILDPVALLNDTLRLVRKTIPPSVGLCVEMCGALSPLAINRTTFVQILLNLSTNAAAAMNGEGTLTVVLEEAPPEPGEMMIPGGTGFVRLRVTDTGCGMSRETLERAFEPFFTTKGVGQGTGLGLPVVFGLVEELGGVIRLESLPGRGTTVTVLLPRAKAG
jgi:diguanylate cyclase (GGDEF)-like protein